VRTLGRRSFLFTVGAGVAVAAPSKPPSYLEGYRTVYSTGPRKAAIDWLRDARFGLFLHYGLYSLLERHEWVQFRELIPVAEYAKLKDRFRAEKFDAGFIAGLAVDAGMKYVNITTRRHDSFNTGPLPDGSIHPTDAATLRALGKRIRQEGFPAGTAAAVAGALLR